VESIIRGFLSCASYKTGTVAKTCALYKKELG
jgi:hypothetical protein